MFNKKKPKDTEAARAGSAKRSSQSVIPFEEWYSNGIFRTGKNRYSIVCEFDNAGYLSRTDAEQERKYRTYHRALSELPDYIRYEECIYNIPVDTSTYVRAIASKEDNYCDEYEKAFFTVQKGFAEGLDRAFSLKRYLLALSTETQDGENPTNKLLDAVNALIPRFREMDSTLRILSPEEVFSELYKYFNPFGGTLPVIPPNIYSKGLTVQDFICADDVEYGKDYIRLGGAYVRILSAISYGEEAVDILAYRIMGNSLAAFMTKYIEHISKENAMDQIKKDLDASESRRSASLRHSERKGAPFVSRDVLAKIEACNELLDALGGNEELLRQTVYVMVAAKSLEELSQATNSVKSAALSVHCTMRPVNSFLERTLQAVLPLGCGCDKPSRHQAMLSSAAAVMTPFSYESRFDPNGFFYGYHNYSGEPVIIDRTLGKSCHGFVLGSTGSGKGMFVKHEISNIVYQPFCKKDRIIVVDAVGEYVPLAEAFGGKIIDISPASDTHLNPLYLSRQREKELGTIKAQAEKSAFLIALLSLFKGDGGLTAAEKSAVDEACAAAYKQRNPTLETLSSELSKMGARGNSVATEMCIWLNRYTAGSVKLFTGEDTAHEDTECRFTVYDLKGLASGDLLDAAMLAMLERIEETVLQNFSEGVRTYIYIDELHRYFDAERNPYAAARLSRFFSELRKFGAIITGITQLPKAVVASPDGSTMLSNSRFIVMAELDTHNADVVSELYDLNEDMRRTLAAPDVGQYVIRTSKAPMSVFLKYPGKEETERNLMYDLFNTSPDHGKNERGS